jgi:hypothetical protein
MQGENKVNVRRYSSQSRQKSTKAFVEIYFVKQYSLLHAYKLQMELSSDLSQTTAAQMISSVMAL